MVLSCLGTADARTPLIPTPRAEAEQSAPEGVEQVKDVSVLRVINHTPKRYTDQHNLLRIPHDVFSGIAQYTRYITVRAARERKGESKTVPV